MGNYCSYNTPNPTLKAVILEYIWLGGNGEFRSKYKTVYEGIDNKLPITPWNYDG